MLHNYASPWCITCPEHIDVPLKYYAQDCFAGHVRGSIFFDCPKFYRSRRRYRKATGEPGAGNSNDFSLERAISLIISIPSSIACARILRTWNAKARWNAIWKCRDRSGTVVLSRACPFLWMARNLNFPIGFNLSGSGRPELGPRKYDPRLRNSVAMVNYLTLNAHSVSYALGCIIA